MLHMHLTEYPQVACNTRAGLSGPAGAAAGFPPPPDHPRRPLLQRRQQDCPFGGGDALVRPPGRGGGGGRNRLPRRLVWISKPLQPDFEAKEDRQTYGMSNGRIGFELGRI